MDTSEILDYLKNNSYCFELPSTVKADWETVQEHFNKGRSVSVIIDEEKMELKFKITLDRDFYYISGEHFSKAYKFKSLDAIAQNLYTNITDFISKRFKITVDEEVVFDGISTYSEVNKLAETFRIVNPIKVVLVAYDFNDDDTYRSFIGNVTWEEQMSMFPYYRTFTDEGTALMKEHKERYEEKYG